MQDHDSSTSSTNRARRQFLKRALGTAGAATVVSFLAGRSLAAEAASDNQASNIPEWMRRQGKPILSPAYGVPLKSENNVMRTQTDLTLTQTSSWSFTPLQDLDGSITPNGLVYERHHGGVPAIDPEQHQLMLHGMVDQPLIFDMNQLRRFPQVSLKRFLECSGNTDTEWEAPSGKTV